MFRIMKVVTLVMCIQKTISDNTLTHPKPNYFPSSSYKGESFPTKYLIPEETVPTVSDLEYYMISLQRTVKYFYDDLISRNDSDVNRVIGMYFMKVVLKRTIREYQEKLTKTHHNILKKIINRSDDFVSRYVHLIHAIYGYDRSTIENRVAKLFRDDTVQVYSLKKFNKGRILKWIYSNIPMHSYTEQMDNLKLARDEYNYISNDMDSYFVNVQQSDQCISHVIYNPEPIDLSEVRPCVPDPYCRRVLLSSPSVAYTLSHRLFNIFLLRHSRRCYIQTEKEDDDLMDVLCTFMYREAVYIARRGFFARDLFLEHVALCAFLGYEEIFRHQWFRKVASWMDSKGCMFESHNFIINQTRVEIQSEKNIKKINGLRKRLKYYMLEECHSHPMALSLIVLAHAVRHTVHFMIQ